MKRKIVRRLRVSEHLILYIFSLFLLSRTYEPRYRSYNLVARLLVTLSYVTQAEISFGRVTQSSPHLAKRDPIWATSSSRADFQYRSTFFAPSVGFGACGSDSATIRSFRISLLSPPKALIDRADQTKGDDKILLGGIYAPTSGLRNYVGKREDGENPVNGD